MKETRKHSNVERRHWLVSDFNTDGGVTSGRRGKVALPQRTALSGFEAGSDASLTLWVLNAVATSDAET